MTPSRSHLARLVLLSWLSMIGVDFFLHAGLLATLYTRASPFLLPAEDAFRLIPLGYLAFLLLAILLLWLLVRLGISDWKAGFSFALRFGLLTWGAILLGIASIATADIDLLVGWWLGQTVELAIAGAVAGHGLRATSLRRLTLFVVGILVGAAVLTIAMQNLGLAPAAAIR